MKMEIVDWPTSYDHYACDMTKEQKECLDFVCKSIDEGNYIDVGDNDNYLFVYNQRLQSRLFYTEKKDSEFCNKKENRLFCHHNTYLSKDYRKVLDKYYEYICAYKKTNPYSIRYAYRTYIFVEFYVADKSVLELKREFIRFIEFIYSNPRANGISKTDLAFLYINLYGVKSTDYVDPRFFEVLVGTPRKTDITPFLEKHKKEIEQERKIVLDDDYINNNINFLYRAYDIKNGSMMVMDSAKGVGFCSEESLDAECYNTHISFRDYYNNGTFKQGYLIPEWDSKNLTEFVKSVMRVSEDVFRQKRGLPEVGGGWTSESLLYKQVEAAFSKLQVYQHYSPAFLGMQHYDVYIPQHKIALEYQGVQHFRPIEYFGGEQAFEKNQQRDQRKKDLSRQNGVSLIEVLPGYDIEDVIVEISNHLSSPLTREQLLDAISKSRNIKKITDPEQIKPNNKVKKRLDLGTVEKKKAIDDELDKIIDELVSEREPSPNAKSDWLLDISHEDFERGYGEYLRAYNMRKTNPDEALSICMELINGDGYRAPVVFGLASQLLRSQKRKDEELELLLQMKRDYGIDNYDSKIRNMIKPRYINEIIEKHPELE